MLPWIGTGVVGFGVVGATVRGGTTEKLGAGVSVTPTGGDGVAGGVCVMGLPPERATAYATPPTMAAPAAARPATQATRFCFGVTTLSP